MAEDRTFFVKKGNVSGIFLSVESKKTQDK